MILSLTDYDFQMSEFGISTGVEGGCPHSDGYFIVFDEKRQEGAFLTFFGMLGIRKEILPKYGLFCLGGIFHRAIRKNANLMGTLPVFRKSGINALGGLHPGRQPENSSRRIKNGGDMKGDRPPV